MPRTETIEKAAIGAAYHRGCIAFKLTRYVWQRFFKPYFMIFITWNLSSFLHFPNMFEFLKMRASNIYCTLPPFLNTIFHRMGPLGRFGLEVMMSVCVRVSLCVCLSPHLVIFFEPSHWPTHIISLRPLIGQPFFPTIWWQWGRGRGGGGGGRPGICQKFYTGKVFQGKILPKRAQIMTNAQLQQNSKKFEQNIYLHIYLCTKTFNHTNISHGQQ